MNSFGDKLEALETAPRFADMPDLAQLRRDSSVSRPERHSSVIFLRKRERLESGEYPTTPQDCRAKRDFATNFAGFSSPLKLSTWTLPTTEGDSTSAAQAEQRKSEPARSEQLNQQVTQHEEAESVIDHQLTIGVQRKQFSESTELDAVSPLLQHKSITSPKFLIKVRRTDTTLALSGVHSEAFGLDAADSCDSPQGELEIPEERPSGLIFADEPTRLHAKMAKVVAYWRGSSLLVPNVFRHVRIADDVPDAYTELQDYSRKELLVQANGLKLKAASCKDKGRKARKSGKLVGCKRTKH